MLARTTSADETRALAAALTASLHAGDVVLLSGEMGAGKTAFTQGVGAGLGIEGRVTSPTFTIVQTYEGGRLRLHHLDVYRLEHLHEALDLDLAEMIEDDAVVVIEWGDAVAPVLPHDYLEIRITFPALDADPIDPAPPVADADAAPGADDERRWHLRPVGPRWAARADGLRAVLAPWEDPSC